MRINPIIRILLVFGLFSSLILGCASSKSRTMGWSAKNIAQSYDRVVNLRDDDNKIIASVDRDWVRSMMVIKTRIERAVEIPTYLLIIEGEKPNAFAWISEQRNMVAFNLAMVEFLQKDADQFAFVFSHEIAHNVEKHSVENRKRNEGLDALGLAVGFGLSFVGVPGGGTISDAGISLVKRKFDRDQEREADALGMRYMKLAGFNPQGAILFNQRMLRKSVGSSIPFLSTHPTGKERIENLKNSM